MKMSFSRKLLFSLGTIALFIIFSSFLTIPFTGMHPSEEFIEATNPSTEEITQAQRIEEYLHNIIPGLTLTYHEVLDMITKEGHNVWIIGGAIRDLLSPDGQYPKDLDFTFDCSMDEVERILIKNNVLHNRIPEYDVITIGKADGCEMEGIENTFSIKATDEELEFTVNTIHYHLNTATFEPRFKKGLRDLEEKKLIVNAKNLHDWLYAGQSERPIKIFRFWKMRGKGYHSSSYLERFMVIEATKAYRKNPEAFKKHMLQYLGSHFSSFDQVSNGCTLVMGPKWCKDNVDSLQTKARALNEKIDSIWSHKNVKELQAQVEKNEKTLSF